MRTTVLNHLHTQHPEAQAEFDRLAAEERRLSLEKARAGEESLEPPKKQRMSEKVVKRDFDAELEDVRAAMDVQREIIASGWVRLVVKGLNRGEYRRLMIKHGPRDDDPLDQQLGYNVDTFGEALIQACLIKTLAHELSGGKAIWSRPASDFSLPLEDQEVCPDWDAWADAMTSGQWEDVFRGCLEITRDPNPAPPLPR